MLNRKIIVSHSGKQHSYHVARTLDELGYLERFYTSSYITSKWLQNIFTARNNQFWSRRFLNGLYGKKVESNWRFEIPEIISSKLYGHTEKTSKRIYQRDVAFDHFMAQRMPQLKGDVFWGFQGSCYESLQAARSSGKVVICELATAHAPAAKRILEEERKLHPEWADSIDNVVFPDGYYERLCEEPHRADYVIGASGFTLRTLEEDGIPKEKLRNLPLGFETAYIPFEEGLDREGPVRLLFAGRISQRKGIKYLLEAMQSLNPNDVELHIIGFVHGSGKALKKYDRYTLHPPLQQYELFRRYGEFDALVLPSVFEGFGLVIVEAMAAGLPVITTPNTIGPELIQQGENGFIVPIRDVQAIVEAVQTLIKADPKTRTMMRKSAHRRASEFSWEAYQKRLSSMLKSMLS